MAESPIGVTFIPSAEQAAEGPRRGNLEGDLGQAFKILSLHLPRVLGARPLAPETLLKAKGASAIGDVNPYAMVFDALLRSSMGGGAFGGGGSVPGGASLPGGGVPPPNVIPGGDERGRVYDPLSTPLPTGSALPQIPRNPMDDKYNFSRERDMGQGLY